MKTLVVSLEFAPLTGGIATYVANYATHLPGEVVVCAPFTKAQCDDNLFPFRVIRVHPFWFFWPRWMRLAFSLWSILRKEKFDIIHIHHILPVGNAVWLVSKLFHIPYIIFFHGTDVVMATRNWFKRHLTKFLCLRAKQLVFNSQFLKNKFETRLGMIFDRATVLYPCPADKFFQPLAPETLNVLRTQLALHGKKVMLSVARIEDGKGFPHLLRLLPDLLTQVPNLIWLIVGVGPKQKELFNEVKKSNLQNVVRFIGAVPLDQLPALYQVADVFVLLTHPDEVKEESFGTVFVEAGASNLPVIAGQSGGVSEAVQHLETGLVVHTYQKNEVVRSILDILTNSDHARMLGARARERVGHEFIWNVQLKKLDL